jgi:hypothetical protein
LYEKGKKTEKLLMMNLSLLEGMHKKREREISFNILRARERERKSIQCSVKLFDKEKEEK